MPDIDDLQIPNDNATPPIVSNDDAQAAQAPALQNPGVATQPQPQTQPAPQNAQPQQPTQPPRLPASQTVSNAPAKQDQNEVHPAIQKAGLLHDVAQALAGGPRMETVIDADGTPRQRPIPLTGRQIGLAIALEAISGSLAGLGAKGPGAKGQAFLLGKQQGERMTDARKEAEQQEFQNRSKQIAAKAAVSEVNSRTLLNTSEAEKYGLDAISKAIEINKPALDALNEDAIDARGVTQQELLDGMQRGKYNSTESLGPIDGYREIQNFDGTKRYEATHVVIKSPNATVKVTPEMYDKYAAAHIPGFPAGMSDVGKNFEIPYVFVQRANEQLAAHTLADRRLDDLRDALKGTPYVDKVPKSVDFNQPGAVTALSRFQRYVSHSAQHGMDVYESLQTMGADKRDPKTGEMQPNPDAKFVDQVAQTFGGWNLLKTAHDKLEADSAATKTKAEAQARAEVEIRKEKDLIPVRAATAGAEAKARANAIATSPRNEDGSWNQASIPVGLVEGNVDPTQLSKRSADYNAKIEQANQYSLQKYGKPFNMAQAQIDYKYASNIGTQNTLKFLNSLTGADNKSGNLAALVAQSNKITRTDFPALNDVAAWTRLQTGDKAIAQYHTAVTEVADQVAKILQGGGTGSGTSDTKLKQAQELFDKGFSKDQIVGVSETLRSLLANRKSEMIGDNRYLRRQYGANLPSASQPIYATNPQTKARVVSNDGGKTWQPTQ